MINYIDYNEVYNDLIKYFDNIEYIVEESDKKKIGLKFKGAFVEFIPKFYYASEEKYKKALIIRVYSKVLDIKFNIDFGNNNYLSYMDIYYIKNGIQQKNNILSVNQTSNNVSIHSITRIDNIYKSIGSNEIIDLLEASFNELKSIRGYEQIGNIVSLINLFIEEYIDRGLLFNNNDTKEYNKNVI